MVDFKLEYGHKLVRTDLQRSTLMTFLLTAHDLLARHRFLNFYGEPNARLSRDQHMVEMPPARCPTPLRPISTLMFNLPSAYVSELESLWVDSLVYADPYKKFMNNCNSEWKEATLGAFGMIL